MDHPIRQIVILGGGSAGWLTAAVLAAEHQTALDTGLRITLIESPEVATVGVGEGTWPTMRDTLGRTGVSGTDFIRECDAAFKQGSKFVRWREEADGDYYHHPFVLPPGFLDTHLATGWMAHRDVPFSMPDVLPGAPVRSGQVTQAVRYARMGLRGQLRLSPGCREARRIPAQALR